MEPTRSMNLESRTYVKRRRLEINRNDSGHIFIISNSVGHNQSEATPRSQYDTSKTIDTRNSEIQPQSSQQVEELTTDEFEAVDGLKVEYDNDEPITDCSPQDQSTISSDPDPYEDQPNNVNGAKDLPPPKFPCPNCPELFYTLSNLMCHTIGHGPNFQCPLCYSWFKKRCGLLCHKRRFHQEVPDSWKDGKSSTGSGSGSHYRRRKPNRVRKWCDICNMSFGDTTSLKSHLRSHYGQRPYVCKHCKFTYTRRTILRNHLKGTHGITDNEITSAELEPIFNDLQIANVTANVLYKCSQCSEVYQLLSQCRAHMSSDHGDAYICDICKGGFSTRSKFEMHRSKWHKDVGVTRIHNQDENSADQHHSPEGEEEETLVNMEDLKQNFVVVADELLENEEDDSETPYICKSELLL